MLLNGTGGMMEAQSMPRCREAGAVLALEFCRSCGPS